MHARHNFLKIIRQSFLGSLTTFEHLKVARENMIPFQSQRAKPSRSKAAPSLRLDDSCPLADCASSFLEWSFGETSQSLSIAKRRPSSMRLNNVGRTENKEVGVTSVSNMFDAGTLAAISRSSF